MGRKRETQPPVDAAFIRECFDIRNGVVVWRERPASHFARRPEDQARFNGQRAGQPAGFKINGQHVVRFQFDGRTRRMAMLRVAWIVATGAYPDGPVLPRNGDPVDAKPENLIVVKAGARPFDQGKGGMASSLERRSQTSTALLRALAENPDATVPQLSQLVGRSESCCCVRLAKLEAQGLTCSPKCQAHIRWQLSQTGKALAASALPLIDDLDKDILMACARAAHGLMALVRVTGSCRLTMRRRIDRLIERGLVSQTDGRYAISDHGRAALGPDAPRPWINVSAVSAALAKDVAARSSLDVMTRVEMGRMGGNATARLRKASLMDERVASQTPCAPASTARHWFRRRRGA